MAFSFGFSGDDIETGDDGPVQRPSEQKPQPAAAAAAAASSAFPVAGKPQLPPTHHPLPSLLSQLPSKIAFSCLDISLDDGSSIRLPRRELWDVRVQLMAEEDVGRGGDTEGLGEHDVKTGVYEGGFKSWESSVDLVKVLAAGEDFFGHGRPPLRVVELGCGTALPSLAMFQWASKAGPEPRPPSFSFVIADYNPTVLQLVTLPNFILTWALSQGASTPELHEACTGDDEQGHELELTPEVLEAFQRFLAEAKISLSFLSGAWSPEFVDLIYSSATSSDTDNNAPAAPTTVVLGAETIYSPFALKSFSETVFAILERERRAFGVRPALAYVGAKRLYFGVGGSLDDFIEDAQAKGAVVNQLREETQGVRRGVVCCSLGGDQSAAG